MTQPGDVRVQRAILSVSDKTGIVDFARGLHDMGVELVSTGGTAGALREAGLPVRAVEDFTGFPEIMGGRVKTLHPKLYAGVLALRDDATHMAAAAEHEVEFVDLVCVNLYPFESTAARRGATEHEVIENIDIGGPTMIRAAAKNFALRWPLPDTPAIPTISPPWTFREISCRSLPKASSAGTVRLLTSRSGRCAGSFCACGCRVCGSEVPTISCAS
jgi:phosphoribosylaminoimidazolecarboxamide formyltransferase/IMP cyclohydrolase